MPRIEPRFLGIPACSVVTVPTGLFRLHLNAVVCIIIDAVRRLVCRYTVFVGAADKSEVFSLRVFGVCDVYVHTVTVYCFEILAFVQEMPILFYGCRWLLLAGHHTYLCLLLLFMAFLIILSFFCVCN